MQLLLGTLINWIASYFGKKVVTTAYRLGVLALFISMFIAAVYAYVAAAKVIISGISQTVPDIVVGVWGWFMPDNTTACLVALGSSVLLRFGTAQLIFILRSKKEAAQL